MFLYKFYLGTLQFGTIDVTEGQIVVMGVMLLSSLSSALGIPFWTSEVSFSWDFLHQLPSTSTEFFSFYTHGELLSCFTKLRIIHFANMIEPHALMTNVPPA